MTNDNLRKCPAFRPTKVLFNPPSDNNIVDIEFGYTHFADDSFEVVGTYDIIDIKEAILNGSRPRLDAYLDGRVNVLGVVGYKWDFMGNLIKE